MVEIDIKSCAGTNIYVLHNMLCMQKCEYFIKEFESIYKMQTVTEHPLWANKLWEFTGTKLAEIVFTNGRNNKKFKISGFRDTITISKCRAQLLRHIDNQTTGDEQKLFFYLTAHSKDGGTNFFEGGHEDANVNKIEIANRCGSAVLFDITLEHESQPFPKGDLKISLGVRPIINYM